jgi:hypothetical protein
MGTDVKALIRLMVTCSHATMDATREAYSRLYGGGRCKLNAVAPELQGA